MVAEAERATGDAAETRRDLSDDKSPGADVLDGVVGIEPERERIRRRSAAPAFLYALSASIIWIAVVIGIHISRVRWII